MSISIDHALLATVPRQAAGTELHWRLDGRNRRAILKQRQSGHCRYRLLSPGSLWIWTLCDGHRTAGAIAAEIAARDGAVQPDSVLARIRQLAADGLLLGIGVEMDVRLQSPRGIAELCRYLLTWRVTFRRVDPLLSVLYRLLGRYLFMPLLRWTLVGIIVGGFAAFVYRWAHQHDGLFDAAHRSAWLLPLFMLACMPLHEGSHAMATKHFGREVIGAGFGWFWLGPFFFVDTSDMWLGGRRERVLVSLAGSISDLAIAGGCSLAATCVSSQQASTLVMFAAMLYLLVLGNLSPMLEYDGYYALADLLDRPNLRRQALHRLREQLGPRRLPWCELRLQRVELAYGIGSILYLIFLLVMNARFNHAYFSALFNAPHHRWTGVLAWLITLLLLLVFLFGLVSDMRDPGRSS